MPSTMNQGIDKRDMVRRWLPGWLGLLLLGVGAVAVYQNFAIRAELERASLALAGEVSQRADQHDAHLTALSAIAQAGPDGPFLEVAATILKFYPRIDEIQLVPLDASAPVTGTRDLAADLAAKAREAALSSTGQPVLLTTPARPGHYLMVKRSPNTSAARYALMLVIDAATLLRSEAPFWQADAVTLRLAMPDGTIVAGAATPAETVQFSQRLGSATQPLVLETGLRLAWLDLVPVGPTLAVLAALSLAWFAVVMALRQRARARRAERRAALSDMETRLAHASRVNVMGEMASGMAHELTQPLTAMLAQAQAGRHLLARQDVGAVAGVLDDLVAQARRASDLLDRLRNWSRPQRPPAGPIDLRMTVSNVLALLAADAGRSAVGVKATLPPEPLLVIADAVEMEQVLFNLVRNAVDAVAGQSGGAVRVDLARTGEQVRLDVADNGPGIDPTMRERLFTPFATTRSEGTGLGLALSQRLVERAGGEIALIDGGSGALFRVTLPAAPGRSKSA